MGARGGRASAFDWSGVVRAARRAALYFARCSDEGASVFKKIAG